MILIVPSYRTAQQARAGFVRQTERDGATTKCGTITFEYLPLRRSIIRVNIAWTTFPTSEIAVRQVAVSRSPNNPVSLGAFLHLALPPLSITRQRLEPHSIDRCDRAHPPALTRCPPAPCGGHDRAPVTLQMHAVLDGAPLGPAEQPVEPPLPLDQRQVAQIGTDMLDQVEGIEHRLMSPAPDHDLTVDWTDALMRLAASTMVGNRSAQPLPFWVKQRTREPSRRTNSR